MNIFASRSTNWNVQDERGRCPLHYLLTALKSSGESDGNFLELIGVAVSSGAGLEFVVNLGNNVLHVAMSTNVDLVQTLLVGHANPKKLINAKNSFGKSCLGLLIIKSNPDWMMQFLVNYGGDIDVIDFDGDNLLHFALKSCDRDAKSIATVIKSLSKMGMDIEAAIK